MLIATIAAGVLIATLIRAVVGRSGSIGLLAAFVLAVVVVAASPGAPEATRSTALLVSVSVLAVAAVPSRGTTAWNARVALSAAVFGLNVVVTAVASPPTLAAILWLTGLAVLAPMAAACFSECDRRIFLAGVVVIACAEAVLAVFEFVAGRGPALWTSVATGTGAELPNPLLGGAVDRVVGTISHPIPLATLLAVAAIIVFAAPRLKPVLRWPTSTLLVGAIVLTGTRSALVAVSAAVLVLLFTSARRGRPLRMSIALLAGGAAVVMSWSDLTTAVSQFLSSGSFTNRSSAIDSAPMLFLRPLAEALFGSGFGSEPMLRDRGYLPQNGFNVVDNQLVTTLATQGIVGLALLLVLLVVWFRRGDRLQRALTVAMVIFYFTFDDLRSPAVIVLLFPLLAMRSATDPLGPPPVAIDTTATSTRTASSNPAFVPALRPRTAVHTGSHR